MAGFGSRFEDGSQQTSFLAQPQSDSLVASELLDPVYFAQQPNVRQLVGVGLHHPADFVQQLDVPPPVDFGKQLRGWLLP